jgi:hypothetical protein
MVATSYSTLMPDGRLLAVEIETTTTGEDEKTTKLAYKLDGKTVTKAQAQAAYDEQVEHWQRGRTFQQMLDFWMGRQSATR